MEVQHKQWTISHVDSAAAATAAAAAPVAAAALPDAAMASAVSAISARLSAAVSSEQARPQPREGHALSRQRARQITQQGASDGAEGAEPGAVDAVGAAVAGKGAGEEETTWGWRGMTAPGLCILGDPHEGSSCSGGHSSVLAVARWALVRGHLSGVEEGREERTSFARRLALTTHGFYDRVMSIVFDVNSSCPASLSAPRAARAPYGSARRW